MTQNAVDEKEAKKEALKARSADMDTREKVLNISRSGKGKRVFLAMTRGKNPQEIQFESFDDSQPKTNPATLSEFMELCPELDEQGIVKRLLVGDYEIAYSEASDPVAEFVNPAWSAEVQVQFRSVVRNYAKATGVSIEDAVALIRPGIEASQAK